MPMSQHRSVKLEALYRSKRKLSWTQLAAKPVKSVELSAQLRPSAVRQRHAVDWATAPVGFRGSGETTQKSPRIVSLDSRPRPGAGTV